MKHLVYIAQSPSGKRYVGLTSRTLDTRWAQHVQDARGKRSASLLQAALRKYGADSFSVVEESVYITRDQAAAREIELIAELSTLAPGGYNLTGGGEGLYRPAPEVRAVLSEKASRRWDGSTAEERQLRCLHLRTHPSPPVIFSPEVRQKMGAASRRRWADPVWRAYVLERRRQAHGARASK